MRHRQHRNAGPGVIFTAINGQRPEMGRRPDEDDQEQQQRVCVDLAGHSHPAQHGRCRARSTTDHDVLRRRPLEVQGVDQRVADQGRQRQPGGERVHPDHQDRSTQHTQHSSKCIGLGDAHMPLHDRPLTGPRHPRIDLPIHHLIDHGGAGRAQRNAQRTEQKQIQRR